MESLESGLAYVLYFLSGVINDVCVEALCKNEKCTFFVKKPTV